MASKSTPSQRARRTGKSGRAAASRKAGAGEAKPARQAKPARPPGRTVRTVRAGPLARGRPAARAVSRPPTARASAPRTPPRAAARSRRSPGAGRAASRARPRPVRARAAPPRAVPPHAAPPHAAPPHDYCKYHGLGNDYLVIEPGTFREALGSEQVRAICDRHRGIGSDGVLLGPLSAGRPPGLAPEVPALRIFNPDGSEGEKSGNGLRIFARYLWEQGRVRTSPFSIHTPGGTVRVRVLNPLGTRIAIEMGAVRFSSQHIPMTGPPREVLRELLRVGDTDYTINAATIGNPHCVVLVDDPTPALAQAVGPLIERHTSFPQRTNVQFLRALDRHAIRIEIWERGAGYTLASGTSSCACAAVACRLGLCESPVTVHMPGGRLEIRVDADYQVEMEGDVAAVGSGRFAPEFLGQLGLHRA